MTKTTFAMILAIGQLSIPAFAHEGHGLGGTHWHPTDVMGFVVAAALVALAIYFGKK